MRIFALGLLLWLSPAVLAGGFGFGPGMLTVVDIVPGKEAEIPGKEAAFEIHNNTEQDMTFVLAVKKPRDAALVAWEKGYDEIQEVAWCRLEHAEIEVPKKKIGRVKLYVTVPDKPEHYNRRWMAAVACRVKSAAKGGSGISLQIVSRVGLETAGKADSSGADAGEVALLPSILPFVDAIPGETFEAALKLRNNGKLEHRLEMKQLPDVEKDEEKHARYFGAGFAPVLKSSWLAPPGALTLPPGETRELKLKITVPRNAAAGKAYEELVFLQDEKGGLSFIRLRVQIKTTPPDR